MSDDLDLRNSRLVAWVIASRREGAFMSAELNAVRDTIVITTTFAGQAAVFVYTRDGIAFSITRGLDDEIHAAALEQARDWVTEHPAEFEALRRQLRPLGS